MEFWKKKKSAEQIISPSLLRPWKWDFEYEYNPDFNLGMGDWISDSDNDDLLFDDDLLFGKENGRESSGFVAGPSAKRQRLSLKLSSKKKAPLAESSNHFAVPVDEQTREKASEGLKPANTEASTRWAIKNFTAWAENRRRLVPDDPVPEDLLECHDHAKVCKYLRLFVLETRKEDGSAYPPATLRSLLSGLNHMLQTNKAPFSVLDKHDIRFRGLFNTLDLVSSSLHREVLVQTKRVHQLLKLSTRICSGRRNC